jgi:hypothetical protein
MNFAFKTLSKSRLYFCSFQSQFRLKSDFVGGWRNKNVPEVVGKFENELLQPLKYFQQRETPFISMMMKLVNEWLNIPEEKLQELKPIADNLEQTLQL